jgi:hypothetical protein
MNQPTLSRRSAFIGQELGSGEDVPNGTPTDIVKVKASCSGKFLAVVLARRKPKGRKRVAAAE